MKNPIKLDIEAGAEWLLPAAKRWLEQAKRAMRTPLGAKVFELPSGEKVTVQWRQGLDYVRISGGACPGYTVWVKDGLVTHVKFSLEPSSAPPADAYEVYMEDGGGSVPIPTVSNTLFIPDLPGIMFFSGDYVVLFHRGATSIDGIDTTRTLGKRMPKTALRGSTSGLITSSGVDHVGVNLYEIDTTYLPDSPPDYSCGRSVQSWARIISVYPSQVLNETVASVSEIHGYDSFVASAASYPSDKNYIFAGRYDRGCDIASPPGLNNSESYGFGVYSPGGEQIFYAPKGSWLGWGVSRIVGFKGDTPALTYINNYTRGAVGCYSYSTTETINSIDWVLSLAGSGSSFNDGTSGSDGSHCLGGTGYVSDYRTLMYINDAGDVAYYLSDGATFAIVGYEAVFSDGTKFVSGLLSSFSFDLARLSLTQAEIDGGTNGYYYVTPVSGYPKTATNLVTGEEFEIVQPEECWSKYTGVAVGTDPVGTPRIVHNG